MRLNLIKFSHKTELSAMDTNVYHESGEQELRTPLRIIAIIYCCRTFFSFIRHLMNEAKFPTLNYQVYGTSSIHPVQIESTIRAHEDDENPQDA